VIRTRTAADSVTSGIKVQLDAIRADFGLAADADIAAGIKAQLDGELTVVAEPAQCSVDIQASLQASASCDAEIDPGSAEVKCTGGCDVDVQGPEVKCSAEADLQCTVVAPEVKCEGECHGTCELDLSAAAACSGTCKGDCDGTCSAYVKDGSGNAKCAGQCSGMCTGKCDVDLAANLTCTGSCKAECTTTNPQAGCKGAVRASCKAKDPSVGIKCDGHCDSKIIPPSAKAECQASAKAQADVNVQCTPPRVALSYKLKAGLDATAKANFTAALTVFGKTRLPALLAELKRANTIKQAGADLVTSAAGAVKTQFTARSGDNKKYSVKTVFGLGCALGQLGDVKTILEKAGTDLGTQISAAGKLTSALKLSS
jgi:hypothetical protein